jgi:hypothetical protein
MLFINAKTKTSNVRKQPQKKELLHLSTTYLKGKISIGVVLFSVYFGQK